MHRANVRIHGEPLLKSPLFAHSICAHSSPRRRCRSSSPPLASPPRPQHAKLASELRIKLLELQGGQRTHQLLLPCPLSSKPSSSRSATSCRRHCRCCRPPRQLPPVPFDMARCPRSNSASPASNRAPYAFSGDLPSTPPCF